VGPRKSAHRQGVTFKVLPLRMEAAVVDKLDEAWRSRGIKNRMEFFRGALGSYLKQMGAEDAAALFADTTAA
jgi:metal-responsive CopG/Arc/MetJ family transcriptional regulator